MDFSNKIADLYEKKGIATSKKQVTYVKPIIEIDKDTEKSILSGDGQKNPDEYKQVNSSTGLAVNYYMILNELGKIEDLAFEDKVAKPLKGRGGMKANLDVSYKRDGKTIYVESKFLEPYYSGNEKIKDAYLERDNYDVPDKDKNAWFDIIKDSQNYTYINFTQICRHLMAIWRKHKKDNSFIELHTVSWIMTDSFIEELDRNEQQQLIERRKKIKSESKKCKERIDDFLRQIGWENITFKVLHYNDMLDDIARSKYAVEFKKRYFLE